MSITRLSKRVTKLTRRFNALFRQVELLREEINAYGEDFDLIEARIQSLQDDLRARLTRG